VSAPGSSEGQGKNKLPFGGRVGGLGGMVGVEWISLCGADRRRAANVLGRQAMSGGGHGGLCGK
jgi:hypothetical protein